MTYSIDSKPLWQPSPAHAATTKMGALMRDTGHADYADLWHWSVDQPEAFWSKIWDFCGAVGEKGSIVLEDGQKMPGRPLVSAKRA
jgi:acetoacetyl-CoA synthetase